MQGGQMLANSMLMNHSIKSIKTEGNVFYIRYIDKLREYS